MFNPPRPPRRSRLFPDLHKSKSPHQPGIIEIKLQEHVRPQIQHHGSAKSRPRLQSLNNVNLDAFHRTLDRVHAHKVEHTVPMTHEQADHLAAKARSQGLKTDHLAHLLMVHVPVGADVEKIAKEFAKLPGVERAEPMPRLSASANPNDPFLGVDDDVKTDANDMEDQWYIFRCNANQSWDKSITGKGTLLAMIDSGFFPTHEDLALNLAGTFNAVAANAALSPPNMANTRHGTGVSGLAAATANNGLGMAGVAFDAKLWMVQVSQNPKPDDEKNATWRSGAGIGWAATQPLPAGINRAVMSISLGIPVDGKPDSTLDTNTSNSGLINTAIGKQIPVCLAAANDPAWNGGDAAIDSKGNRVPGSDAIIVGATSYSSSANKRAGFSNFGPRITLCAPGDPAHDLTCAVPLTATAPKYTNNFGGTSGATPKVAGAVALMLQANSALTPEQVKLILNGTGRDRVVTGEEDFSKPVGPLLDAVAAVIHSQRVASQPRLISNRFLNFGEIDKGAASDPQTVTIFNIGQAPLNLKSPTQTQGGTDFAISGAPAFPLIMNAGDPKQSFNITFKPTSRGDQIAKFELQSDDPDTPLTVVCTGTTPSLTWLWILLGIAIAGAAAFGVYKLLKATHTI